MLQLACSCICCPPETPEYHLWRLLPYSVLLILPNRIIYYSSDPHNRLTRNPVGNGSPHMPAVLPISHCIFCIMYINLFIFICHKIVSFLICWVESWCEPAWVYFRGLFWRNALSFSQAAFSTTAAIPLRTGKCHGRADDGGFFFHAAGRAATLRSTVRERRQSIAPPSVKSWLSAEIWCNEPLQLLLPLCDRRFKAL